MKFHSVTLLILLVCGVSLLASLIIKSQGSVTLLSFNHNDIKLQSYKITKEKHISFIIKSIENYLGIISIRFKKDNIIGKKGNLIIELSDPSSGKIQHIQSYPIEWMPGLIYFPFGFTPIADSKDRLYLIKLSLINADANTTINIENRPDNIMSSYKYPLKYLISSYQVFIKFICYKFLSFLVEPEQYFAIFSSLVPAFYYILFNLIMKSRLSIFITHIINQINFNQSLNFIKLIFVLITLQMLANITSLYYFCFVILLWVAFIIKFKKNSKLSIIVALVLISFMPFYLITKAEIYSEQLALWSVVFIIIGAIHESIDSFFTPDDISH